MRIVAVGHSRTVTPVGFAEDSSAMQVQRKRQRKPKVDGFWLQGEMTLGLCDLTHLSMRVGLYLMDLPEVNIFSIAGGRVRVSGAIAGDYLRESLAPGQANGTARLEPAASAVSAQHHWALQRLHRTSRTAIWHSILWVGLWVRILWSHIIFQTK